MEGNKTVSGLEKLALEGNHMESFIKVQDHQTRDFQTITAKGVVPDMSQRLRGRRMHFRPDIDRFSELAESGLEA